MKDKSLGRLERVDLRPYWQREDTRFAHWLTRRPTREECERMRRRETYHRGLTVAGLVVVGLTVVMCDTERAAETLTDVAAGLSRVVDDLGRRAEDAGAAVLDHVDGADVRAEPRGGDVYTGKCDKKWEVTSILNGETSSASTQWFSVVQVPGFDPTEAPFVSVVLCAPEWSGTKSHDPCPEDTDYVTYTCSGWHPSDMQCAQSLPVGLKEGEVIVSCGGVTEVPGGEKFGYKYNDIFVRVGN